MELTGIVTIHRGIPKECALRFLRARKFDYEKTRDMIAEALQKFKEVSAALS